MSGRNAIALPESDTIQRASTTYLNLLTRDGAVAVEFTPGLEPQHYAELFTVVQDFDSVALMRVMVTDAAKRWGRQVTF